MPREGSAILSIDFFALLFLGVPLGVSLGLAGMLLDAASILVVFLAILLPIARQFGWDLTWPG